MNSQILRRFEWSVRALAQPAEIQLGLDPDFVWVPDELAFEFDEWYKTFCAFGGRRAIGRKRNWTPDTCAIDQQLASMSAASDRKPVD